MMEKCDSTVFSATACTSDALLQIAWARARLGRLAALTGVR